MEGFMYMKLGTVSFIPYFKAVGVNPCVTGDTLVFVADGRGAVPIKVLAEEGKDVPVHCYDNETNNCTIKMMRNNTPKSKHCIDVDVMPDNKLTEENQNIVDIFNNFISSMNTYLSKETNSYNMKEDIENNKLLPRLLNTFKNVHIIGSEEIKLEDNPTKKIIYENSNVILLIYVNLKWKKGINGNSLGDFYKIMCNRKKLIEERKLKKEKLLKIDKEIRYIEELLLKQKEELIKKQKEKEELLKKHLTNI
jgi:hypothetical protein